LVSNFSQNLSFFQKTTAYPVNTFNYQMIEFNARYVPFTNGTYVVVLNRGSTDLNFTTASILTIVTPPPPTPPVPPTSPPTTTPETIPPPSPPQTPQTPIPPSIPEPPVSPNTPPPPKPQPPIPKRQTRKEYIKSLGITYRLYILDQGAYGNWINQRQREREQEKKTKRKLSTKSYLDQESTYALSVAS
jgi:outer membrane biosynthesis protein TonB